MCWSAEVSQAFGTLDLVFVGLLLWKKYHASGSCKSGGVVAATRSVFTNPSSSTFYGTYASFLLAITIQEWAQYAAWTYGHLVPTTAMDSAGASSSSSSSSSSCTGWGMVFSLLATGSAMSIPLVFIVSAILTAQAAGQPTQQPMMHHYSQIDGTSSSAIRYNAVPTSTRNGQVLVTSSCVSDLLWKAFAFWLAGASIIVGSVIHTQTYCIELGRNHHQVWVCASAVYKTGGFPLFFAMLFLYILSCLCSLFAIPSLPPTQRQWIYTIGLSNAAIAFGWYSWTLEACSIWCWSAFSYGLYFCYICLSE